MSNDDSSRRDEINAFAAMATGASGALNETDGGNSGTFDFSAAIRVDNSSNHGDGDSFLKHLRQSGDPDQADDFVMDSARKKDDPNNSEPDDEEAFRKSFAQAGDMIDNSGTFSRLTPGTGISRFQSSGSAQHRKQNLAAAALALADPSDEIDAGGNLQVGNQQLGSNQAFVPSQALINPQSSSNIDRDNTSHSNSVNNNFLQYPCGAALNNPNMMNNDALFGGIDAAANTTGRSGKVNTSGATGASTVAKESSCNSNIISHFGQIPQNKTPMHAQKVQLERPLFFGPHLPPRVIKEAQRIVDEAIRCQWQKEMELSKKEDNKSFTPRVGQLPSGVRNLVSAIRCYGFGLDIVPRANIEGNDIDHSSTGTSSPYISVFCPRWSDDRKRPFSSTTGTTMTSIDDDVGPLTKGYDTMKTQDTHTTATSALRSSIDTTGQQEEKEMSSGSDDPASMSLETSLSERDRFSAFARHGSDYSAFSATENDNVDNDISENSDDSKVIVRNSKQFDGSSPSKVPRNALSGSERSDVPESKMIRSSGTDLDTPNLSEQALFTQLVHAGESPAHVNNSKATGGTFNFGGSLRGINSIVPGGDDNSDDDSVVGSEMKTKVGVNEHLNAALASLEDGQSPAEAIESDAVVEESGGELTQVPLTKDGGRPLSNQELMNAHAPLFAVDDPPLPSESDLGNHETREEQQRSKEQRRIQAFIEKYCPYNVFGPLACPNPATSPEDNHSWNSLSTPLQRNPSFSPSASNNDHHGSTTTSPMGHSISSDDITSMHSTNGYGLTAKKVSQLASTPRGYDPRTRYGWWNISDQNDNGIATDSDESRIEDEEAPIQLPPVEHPTNGFPIQTFLEPTPETLLKQNRSLSELHPATSLSQALPFISDRPPSYRYLQVDTRKVHFEPLAEELEPLFCSLAIYNVETIAHSLGDRGMAPIPDLERCGKVTETLNFDYVKNPEVENQCHASIAPYTSDDAKDSSHLTSCGVFPLPSNLSVNNLYVIITVGKVISEGVDFEPYLRAKAKGKDEQIDIKNLRAKAGRASTNHGNFIMPFAFGVAPLLQVFGADVPRVPSSRAVQIPLFRFYAGNGERQIIDHIMVMLYPRADHRASGIGGPAPLTNGGHAMLVMRNFGYLGLHEVVNGKSSLAMDRLIDFTGELQLRRKFVDGNADENSKPSDGKNGGGSQWRSDYKAEPTVNGGRCKKSHATLNAQELAPIPLLTAPLGRSIGGLASISKSRTRGFASGEDIEPYFHTTFCNELLCYPKQLRNCEKGNIVVKVEMRDIEWNAEYGVYLAHMPAHGPVVHNLRRGPFLVQGAYTSCSARRPDPHFLDEFKLKLPLLLGNNESQCASIFFTVYRLSFSSRKKWGLRGLSRKRPAKKFEEITGDLVGESDVVTGKDCQLIQLGCGFLPLEEKQSLLENGNHDVRISYIAKYPLKEFCEKEGVKSDTLVMSDFTIGKGDSAMGDESVADDGDSQCSDRYLVDTLSATSASDRDTVLSENMDDNKTKHLRKQAGMLLQVRISVQSSIHSQNATLNEFLGQEPDVTIPLEIGGDEIISFLRTGNDAISRPLSAAPFRAQPEDVQYETKKLLISTADLAKPDMCSVSEISLHLVRVCKQLWKVAVVGTGNHDLEWANPAAALPLRVNAFATLLQVLGSSTVFLSKRGVTQLDGNGKFNFPSLGRVMGLLFDEKEMFGDSNDEIVSDEFLSLLRGDQRIRNLSSKKGKGRHIRSNFEFGNGSDGVTAIISENPYLGETSSGTTSRADESATERTPCLEKTSDMPSPPTLGLGEKTSNESKACKIDTVNDFKNAMQTGNREKEFEDIIHEGQFSGNAAAASWIAAFGDSSGGNRRWMTAPAPGLSTIQEDAGDGEEPKPSNRKAIAGNQGPLDSLDAEIILSGDSKANASKKRPVKQFRVPKRSTKQANNNESKEIRVDSHQPIDLTSGITFL